MPAETTLTTTASDGLRLAFSQTGTGTVTLVFVHGWCGSRQIWARQIEAFRDRFSIIALDLAGHGESTASRDHWSIPAFGSDVARVVSSAVEGQVILLGHSMAGEAIVEAALRLEDRVLGLVGVDSLWNVSREITETEIEATLEPFDRNYREAASAYIRSLFLPDADPALVDEMTRSMLVVPPAIGRGVLEGILRHRSQLRANLSQLEPPITLINSEDWRTTNLDAAAAYGLQVHPLHGVGHFSMLERPEALHRILEAVLSKILALER